MPSLTLPDRLIWFAHCPKAGGTSVEQAMVARWGDAVGHLHWGWDLWWRRGGWRVADPPNSPQHLVWQDALAVLPRAPDRVFAVVRDPIARMASEHRWQRRGRRATHLGRAVAWLPFPLWLRVMLAAARQHPYVLDNHFQPQSRFVPENAEVFHLEQGLTQVADWLSTAAGGVDMLEDIPHAIPSGSGPEIARQEAFLIGQAFVQDYTRFGYTAPAPAQGRPVLEQLAKRLAPVVVWLDRRGAL